MTTCRGSSDSSRTGLDGDMEPTTGSVSQTHRLTNEWGIAYLRIVGFSTKWRPMSPTFTYSSRSERSTKRRSLVLPSESDSANGLCSLRGNPNRSHGTMRSARRFEDLLKWTIGEKLSSTFLSHSWTKNWVASFRTIRCQMDVWTCFSS